MQRAQGIREWAKKRDKLLRKLDDLQNQWLLLAGQGVGLPLSFRRDMTLGKWSERFACATILQHLAAYPATLDDPEMFKSQQLEATWDMLLSETETCLVSRGWYAMLQQAS